MVLLENFGAAPFGLKLTCPAIINVTCSLPRKVTLPMTPGIPKFRKEGHPERAGNKRGQIHSHLVVIHGFAEDYSYPAASRY
jgi:hypothetical protein